MKNVLAIVVAALLLVGCSNVETAWKVVTEAQVSPQQIIIAANAFDAAEASATQYLLYCKAGGKGTSACALSTRQKVVTGVRSGRSARNALEPYVVSGGAGPSGIYNTLIAAVSTLQTNTPAVGATQ